jgi:hypothetical protein
MSSWQKLIDFVKENPRVAYDSGKKIKFKNFGRKALIELGEYLTSTGLIEDFEYSYNKGGIAVSGDHHLKAKFTDRNMCFHLFFNLDTERSFVYRKTTSYTDHTGGQNHFAPIGTDILKICNSLSYMANKDRGYDDIQQTVV